jgi:hypothetical protein
VAQAEIVRSSGVNLPLRSRSVHRRPRSSPCLNPVWTATMYRASLRSPLAALSNALTWSLDSASASLARIIHEGS